jgi:hypothetical protein
MTHGLPRVSGPSFLDLKPMGTRHQTGKEKQMPKGFYEDCEGPIRGLRLPLNAWDVLHRERITTLAQLRTRADRIDRLPGIGAKTALAIRAELARVRPAD